MIWIQKMSEKLMVRDLEETIFKNYYQPTEFTKEDSCYYLKKAKKILSFICYELKKKVPDPSKDKEYYELFFKNEGKKTQKYQKL